MGVRLLLSGGREHEEEPCSGVLEMASLALTWLPLQHRIFAADLWPVDAELGPEPRPTGPTRCPSCFNRDGWPRSSWFGETWELGKGGCPSLLGSSLTPRPC